MLRPLEKDYHLTIFKERGLYLKLRLSPENADNFLLFLSLFFGLVLVDIHHLNLILEGVTQVMIQKTVPASSVCQDIYRLAFLQHSSLCFTFKHGNQEGSK